MREKGFCHYSMSKSSKMTYCSMTECVYTWSLVRTLFGIMKNALERNVHKTEAKTLTFGVQFTFLSQWSSFLSNFQNCFSFESFWKLSLSLIVYPGNMLPIPLKCDLHLILLLGFSQGVSLSEKGKSTWTKYS